MTLFCFIAEVIEGRGVAVEAISNDVGLFKSRGDGEGDIEGASGIFGGTARGEEPGLKGIEFRILAEPDPAFFPSDGELRVINKETFVL